MDRLEEVCQKIIDDGIELREYAFGFCDAAALNTPEGGVIYIDKQKCMLKNKFIFTLMHEHSHFKTGTTQNVRTPFMPESKYEYQANKRAVMDYLPYDVLITKIRQGYVGVWELADELNLPPNLVEWAIKIYRRMGKLT